MVENQGAYNGIYMWSGTIAGSSGLNKIAPFVLKDIMALRHLRLVRNVQVLLECGVPQGVISFLFGSGYVNNLEMCSLFSLPRN
jgi:hypothetical protein